MNAYMVRLARCHERLSDEYAKWVQPIFDARKHNHFRMVVRTVPLLDCCTKDYNRMYVGTNWVNSI